jgi:phosphoribosylformimino-5-aminoimidazole carboxamide ribotide isomerase
MRFILACDLKGGTVVRGVRGDRSNYRPIAETSRIVTTSEPLGVIEQIRPKETYIADLDKIMGMGDNALVIASMSRLTRTMADVGVKSASDASSALKASNSVILGTETASLDAIRQSQGKRSIVSLDMKHGRMMCSDLAFNVSPLKVVEMLNGLDLGAIILLDVARVGSGEGIDLDLLAKAAGLSRHPVIIGGGVRGVEDLERAEGCGAEGAIIASAVHDGKIPLNVLRA